MTLNEICFENFINSTHSLCGIKLKPLNLNHLILLNTINSPILNSENVTKEDIFITALICSKEEPSIDDLSSFYNKIKGWFLLKIYNNPYIEMIKFNNYVSDFLSLPEMWEAKTKTDKSKINFYINLASTIFKYYNWKKEDVFKMPIGQLFWFYYAIAESEGNESLIISDEEKEIFKKLEELKKDEKEKV